MGNDVRVVRAAAGLPQAELADLVDVSRQTIGALEGGDDAPSTVLALRLAVVLGHSVDALFHLPSAEVERLRRQREVVGP